jgi:ribosomal protein L16 Arg81 hydroxylase
MPTYPTLASLLDPVSADDFLADYWESRPLVLSRGRPDAFRHLLSVDAIGAFLASRNLRHPDVSLVNHQRKLESSAYTFASGLIDEAALHREFAAGSTLVLSALEGELPALFALTRALESELSVRFQANIYCTPSNAQGFHPHYDSHDVIVLQVQGRKRWMLYDTPITLPYRRQEFHPDDFTVGPLSAEFTLEAGDVLYIPRGLMHDARSLDETSLHITLGALHTSVTEVLAEALSQLGLREVDFRRGTPVGYARPGFDRTATVASLRALLRRVADEANLDAALEHFAHDLVSTRHPRLPGQMAQLAALDALSVDTRLVPRPGLLYQLAETGDTVALALYGQVIRLPVHAAEPLGWALAQSEPFRVGDLPGALDDDGKLVLARRLVREGALYAPAVSQG